MDYQFELTNYEVLDAKHQETDKIQVRQLPVDTSHLIILRQLTDHATATYQAKLQETHLTPHQLKEIVLASEFTKKEVHHKSKKNPFGIYSSQALFYKGHYGKILKNETRDFELDFILSFTRL